MALLRRLILPPVVFLMASVVMIGCDRLLPGIRLLAAPWTWLGVVPAALGLALGLWAVRGFRRAGTPVRPFQTARQLVVAGPYRRTRNPMYLGLALMLAGVAVGLGSLTPWLVLPAFVVAVTWLFIVPEERRLEDRFGDAFRRYRSSVRRWL